eukprot:SAG31_NODE_18604_length_630_cov_0.736347_1_plen_69_part_10
MHAAQARSQTEEIEPSLAGLLMLMMLDGTRLFALWICTVAEFAMGSHQVEGRAGEDLCSDAFVHSACAN